MHKCIMAEIGGRDKTRKLNKKPKLNENRFGNLEILTKQEEIYEF